MPKNDGITKTNELKTNKTTDSHRINETDLKKELEFISDVSPIIDGKKEGTLERGNSVPNEENCGVFKETIKNKKSVHGNRDNTKNSAQIKNKKSKNK